MKFRNKLAATVLALTLTVGGASALTGCSSDSGPITEDVTSNVAVDLDYSMFSTTMLYDTMARFSPNSEHMGKTMKIRADYGAVFDFCTNTFTPVVEQYDATACCAAYYPIELAENVKRPALGSRMEMIGTFNGDRITVTAITLYSGCFDDTEIEIDVANMLSDHAKEFVKNVGRLNNEYVGKTVRICGHFAKSNDGFYYVQGGDTTAGDNSLNPIWSIEIHSNNIDFPEITGNYIRAYEVIGTVSSYKTEDGKEWPCIEVQSIRPITTYTV